MTGIRLALRALLRSPIVTAVVVLSLGLGIGANTAIFSLLYQVLLRSLPVQNPQEIVFLEGPGEFKFGRSSSNGAGGMESIFSYPLFRELERNPGVLTALAGFRDVGGNLSYNGKTLSGRVTMVSGRYFGVLGVQPQQGRLIEPDDDKGNGNPVAVLSYGYWVSRLGSQQGILNQPFRINGQVLTIVGVAPKEFHGTVLGTEPDVFVPMALKLNMTPGWDGRDRWNDHWIYMFGRLGPGVSREQAATAINTTFRGLMEQRAKEIRGRDQNYINRFRAQRLSLIDGRLGSSDTRKQMDEPLKILLVCTALVLLIACGNAANLLLARAAQRGRELAIRAALGAGRTAIMRQLLTEALLLSVAGGLVGILLGFWTLDALLRTMSDDPAAQSALKSTLEWPVLLFALAVSLGSGLLFGLYPALAAARESFASTIKDTALQSTSTTGGVRVRKLLVCGQVALSMLLLVPMGLFLKSLLNLVNEDLGMRTERVITFGISPELNSYNPAQSRALFERAETELAAIPGIEGVATSLVALIAGNNWGTDLTVEGYRRGPGVDTNARLSAVGPGFFSKMGIPLVSGREFTDADVLSAPRVAVVNEAFARHFFNGANPVGRRFSDEGGDAKTLDIEIVGLIKDAKYDSVRDKAPTLFYTPYRQSKQIGEMYFYVRSALPTAVIVPQIRKAMASIDPDLPLENLRTLDEQVSRNIRGNRLVLQLAVAFAALATALAMLGLYGVMAYGVTRRTREIGIRIALGAPSTNIKGLVMREVLFILGGGVVVGLPVALGVARYAKSQLFGVEAYDATVIAGAIVALAAASLLAGYLPARKAARLNPVDALRYE